MLTPVVKTLDAPAEALPSMIECSFHQEADMPKYLLQVSYTPEGAKGLQKDGGTKRRQAAKGLVESVGGKIGRAHV